MSAPNDTAWLGRTCAMQLAEVLFAEPGTVVEIRAFGVDGVFGKGIQSGYFDNPGDFVAAAAQLDGKAKGVFATLNPVNPALLARAHNRMVSHPAATTGDHDVVRRLRFLVDVDPVRPSGVSSTDKEEGAAFGVLKRIAAFLESKGFPPPLKGCSGNGGHLVYSVDLPTDDGGLLSSVLKALAFQFNTPEAEVDLTVGNPARISKVYGTLARKGDSTKDRPHRRSRLVSVPPVLEVVTREQLERVAAMAPPPEPPRSGPSSEGPRIDVPTYAAQHGLELGPKTAWQGAVLWRFGSCPLSSEHDDGAYIIQYPSGAICCGCHHNSCLGKGWQDLRDLLEPDRQNRQNRQKPPSGSSVSTSPGENKKWGPPKALPPSLPPVKEVGIELVPKRLQPWVRDIVERMQCPLAYVAASVLVMLGGVLGKRLTIRPKRYDNWTVVANLWGALIGRPSTMKSPALREVFGLMKRLEDQARIEFEKEEKAFQAKKLVEQQRLKVFKDRIKKAVEESGEAADDLARECVDQAPEEPVRRRYIVNDASVEKLGMLLNENANGLTQFRDEQVGWLKSMDRDGQECSRAFYLEAWDGLGSFTYDRVGRGTLEIENAVVSVFGGIQPGPFAAYMRDARRTGKGDDGLVQRLQVVVWPDVSRNWENIDRPINSEARKVAYEVVTWLDELDPARVGGELDAEKDIWFLRFEEEAQPIFDEWRAALELRLRREEEHPAIESHLGKYRSLVPSIALITHLVNGGTGPVSRAALEVALAWVDVLESHAMRVYGAVFSVGVETAKLLLKKVKAGKLQDGFAARDVYRKGWAGLNDSDAVREGLEVLCDTDWLREVREATPGRDKVTYLINPAAFDQEAEDQGEPAPRDPEASERAEPDRQTAGSKTEMHPGGTDNTDRSLLSALSASPGECPDTAADFLDSPPGGTDRTDKRVGEDLLSVLSVPPTPDSETEEVPFASIRGAADDCIARDGEEVVEW